MGISALSIAGTLVALSGLAVADEESEWDPLDTIGKCTAPDNAAAENLRAVLAHTTAMVTICLECDDVRPRRRDLGTLRLEPFNGGTLNTVLVDGAPIDLAQTFVALDDTKLESRFITRRYSSAPYLNLAVLVGCPVYGPVLRGIRHADLPVPPPVAAPVPRITTTETVVVERGNWIVPASLGLLAGIVLTALIRR